MATYFPGNNFLTEKLVDWAARESLMSGYGKPEKYCVSPRWIIRIPYLVLDREYDDYGEGRRGLFVAWKEIRIGEKKTLNAFYKEEMKRWKNRPKTISFRRYGEIKV